MNKHTPGPWFLEMPNKKRKPSQFDHNQKVLVMACDHSTFNVAEVGGPSNIEELETWKANARLIAAAPELLDALTQARIALTFYRNWMKNHDGTQYPFGIETEEKSLAAITKATE